MASDLNARQLLSGGDLNFVRGTSEVGQNAKIRLLMLNGEYKYNLTLGCRWLDLLFKHESSYVEKRGELRRVIESTPGIATIERLRLGVRESNNQGVLDVVGTTVFNDSLQISQEFPTAEAY